MVGHSNRVVNLSMQGIAFVMKTTARMFNAAVLTISLAEIIGSHNPMVLKMAGLTIFIQLVVLYVTRQTEKLNASQIEVWAMEVILDCRLYILYEQRKLLLMHREKRKAVGPEKISP